MSELTASLRDATLNRLTIGYPPAWKDDSQCVVPAELLHEAADRIEELERRKVQESRPLLCGDCGSGNVSMTFAFRDGRWAWRCDACHERSTPNDVPANRTKGGLSGDSR